MKPGLARLTPRMLDGKEPFQGAAIQELPLLVDYWRWSASTLMDNVSRGVLAEFVVATALRDCLPNEPRAEWVNYDLEPVIDGRRVTVEVKSSARVQSWRQEHYSKLTFGIRATSKWDESGQRLPPSRADVYVFCALTGEVESHVDALDLDKWEFRVVLGEMLEDRKTIAWRSLAGMGANCRFVDLARQIKATAAQLDEKHRVENDTTPAEDRRGIGPQVAGEHGFISRMRLHQSWYRDVILDVCYGNGTGRAAQNYYGNMLDEDAAKAGRNFLTPAIRALADTRIAEGGGMVDADRLRRNMLSSQPMCFNLFGELAAEPRHGTSLVRALWGDHIGEVTSVRFEWAPTPASEYLSDKTAFDAFIEYDASDGKPGFIAIETKLTEPFSQTVYDGDKYRRWMTQDAPWREDAQPDVSLVQHNQLWRDHLLAWALLKHPESEYGHGRLAVVFHGGDDHAREVIGGYRKMLRDDASFETRELAEIVLAWKPRAGGWLLEFERRYVDLSGSEALT